ncbi:MULTISPECIES: TonB-dependent receptor [unclassified Janthinobacterium]|uniref:TonB-dependent receptor n=1 Tax=unclassified Janthinobacterium TaxID=2610881 RepID=UPI000C172FC4|nr:MULTISPECIES: TonB-dependent receptor [unclassified Janthinobacterium]MDO8069181.1 TonB-dependent receptor [Janthinobacterium sp. SUN206]MDO8074110.1 TonB-dependent receptor [Janthinobacterium sp. SUN176]MED5615688.1 TonB-dependent receptor [Janthinobacterium sp. P210005]PIF09533.1 iron complex outermembrane receptor protein [Janthinobacterium sp. 13]
MKRNLTPAAAVVKSGSRSRTPIAAAVAVMVAGLAFSAQAQEAPADDVTTVTVTGVRASLEKSLKQKRNADSVVEVVTAEDIGKMPDRNVADAIQRLPGVNTQSSAGGEGGFGENDRVSLRGTSPSLQQTLFNGHAISTGDWFVLNQYGGNVGRSSSFSLLPSELVSSVVVKKSATADLVEGGVSGAIDVITRRPLEFKNQITAEGSIQAVYNDLSSKTEPQFSGLVNWKNDTNTLGVMLQGFSQKTSVRRDGQEILGYTSITADSAAAKADPSLVGVRVPTFIGASYFTQKKTREGGAFDVEFKPNKDLTLDFNGFYSQLKAPNQNTNFLAAPGNSVRADRSNLVPTNYTVKNGTLVGATFASNAGEVDNAYRPDAGGETYYLDFNFKYRASKDLTFTGKLGKTHGVGYDRDDVYYQNNVNGGMAYALNGMNPATVSYPGGNTSSPQGTGWIGGGESQSVDKELYTQIDGELRLSSGIWDSIKFGARFTDHKRSAEHPYEAGPGKLGFINPGPVWNGTMFPGNYGNNLGGNVPNNYFLYDGQALANWGAVPGNRNVDRVVRHNWKDEFKLQEKTQAVYGMANVAGDNWSGNFGVRAVHTKQTTTVNSSGGPLSTAFGDYSQNTYERSYNDFLPSANIKFDVNRDIVVRAALAKTIARPDYSALGGAVALNDDTISGTKGNVNLNPVRSNNAEVSAEWYFAPKSAVSAGIFYMDLNSIVAQRNVNATYFNTKVGANNLYQITESFNTKGKNKGVELSYQQPVLGDFGVLANYTYADGKLNDGSELLNASKNTYNLTAFYEAHGFSARLAYNYRSAYKAGVDRGASQHVDDSSSLAGSLNYKINEHFTITFDALNLTNETIKMYAENKEQPRAFYSNGRTFYLGLRGKL